MELLDVVLNKCCSNEPKFEIVYDCSPNPDETIKVCVKCFEKPFYSNKSKIKKLEVIS